MTSPRDNDASIASHGSLAPTADTCATRFAIFSECPQCGHALHPEHAHYKCAGCGWRDSCCD
ncbi:MAG: hypothetical protein ACKO48_04355 [Actinomycetota bacterium]